MITAKNYAAQAIKGLTNSMDVLTGAGLFDSTDNQMLKELMSRIKSSVHFVLPDNAKIFDDNKKGIKDVEIRLPYPEITIEYFIDETDFDRATQIYSPKRLIYACMFDPSKRNLILPKEEYRPTWDGEFILIYSISEMEGHWLPGGLGWLMPARWDDISSVPNLLDLRQNKTNVSFSGRPVVLSQGACRSVREHYGPEAATKGMLNDITTEVSAVLELCEALTCSNVTTAIHQRCSMKNEKRAGCNKLPIYETKVLVLNTDSKQSKLASDNQILSGKASPRQHLRRGHIRRLQTSNIWVNSCVVGDAANGLIEKQYRVV